jgi:hypothetical protein
VRDRVCMTGEARPWETPRLAAHHLCR